MLRSWPEVSPGATVNVTMDLKDEIRTLRDQHTRVTSRKISSCQMQSRGNTQELFDLLTFAFFVLFANLVPSMRWFSSFAERKRRYPSANSAWSFASSSSLRYKEQQTTARNVVRKCRTMSLSPTFNARRHWNQRIRCSIMQSDGATKRPDAT